MNRLSRAIATMAGSTLAVAGLAWGAIHARARRALPQISGTLRLRGLQAPVEILRDRWGVPHIYARSAEDLFFAQGFVHAQDRLWQMDFGRRLGSGRLAEILGPKALEADCFTRTIGMLRNAGAEIALLSEEERRLLDCYVAGINALIEGLRPNRLPIEYALLQIRPEPWRPEDSIAWGKVLALAMAGNWETEIVRALMIARLGPERAAALEPEYPQDHPVTVALEGPLGAVISALGREALDRAGQLRPYLGRGGDGGSSAIGSNAWAIGGARSATGAPLLAGDPHLTLMLPPIWYENHLCGGPYHVAGASLPGVPGVIIGHNQYIAWSVTNAGCDVQDLSIERFEQDSYRYATPDGWAEAQVLREEIRVRGRREPEVIEVVVTRHGPIIGRLQEAGSGGPPAVSKGRLDLPRSPFAEALSDSRARYGLALRWTALDPANNIRSILQLNRAEGWEDFRAALGLWTDPALNFVYADCQGRIGYVLGGRIPRRPTGASPVPVPGWTGQAEWDGIIPPEEMPTSVDPPSGYIVSANSRIAGEDYPHHLSYEWINGYRARRITELIEGRKPADLDDFAAWQMDFFCRPGRELALIAGELLGDLPDGSPLEREALEALRSWDGFLDATSVGGAIYEVLLSELQREVFAELEDLLPAYLGSALNPLFGASATTLGRSTPLLLAALRDGEQGPLGPDRQPREVLRQALRRAVQRLSAALGRDVGRWRWGALHQAVVSHALGEIRPLDRLFNRGPFPIGGDTDTVCQVGYHPANGFAGKAYAAGYRQVCDPGNWDRSRSVVAGGQSGHIASRHYDDQLRLWRAGELHPMLWSRELIEEHTVGRLIVVPKEEA
ncbi:MAG: peptidase S45 [Herpetosiphonaceae bacterium]|nr:MAG: peptidase S45 [Herpetosiphonaceae bacterium]